MMWPSQKKHQIIVEDSFSLKITIIQNNRVIYLLGFFFIEAFYVVLKKN